MGTDADREDEIWQGGYSGKDMAAAWVIGGAVTLAGAAVCVLLGVLTTVAAAPVWIGFAIVATIFWISLLGTLIVRKLSIDYRLTTQRLIRKTGLLSRKTGRVEVIDIDDVSIEQNLLQRLFNVGRIKVHSSDVTDPELLMLGIENPSHVADLIDKARRDERVKRGVHIERV